MRRRWARSMRSLRAAEVVTLGDHQRLLPGLVDLHVHAPQWPQLGTGLDVPLQRWLDEYTFPLEARYADTRVGCTSVGRPRAGAPRARHHDRRLLRHRARGGDARARRACLEHGQRAFVGQRRDGPSRVDARVVPRSGRRDGRSALGSLGRSDHRARRRPMRSCGRSSRRGSCRRARTSCSRVSATSPARREHSCRRTAPSRTGSTATCSSGSGSRTWTCSRASVSLDVTVSSPTAITWATRTSTSPRRSARASRTARCRTRTSPARSSLRDGRSTRSRCRARQRRVGWRTPGVAASSGDGGDRVEDARGRRRPGDGRATSAASRTRGSTP